MRTFSGEKLFVGGRVGDQYERVRKTESVHPKIDLSRLKNRLA